MTLATSKDDQIAELRKELGHTNGYRLQLKNRRDLCFKALFDIQTERRVLLGEVNKKGKVTLQQQQINMEKIKQLRMGPHEEQDYQMENWER